MTADSDTNLITKLILLVSRRNPSLRTRFHLRPCIGHAGASDGLKVTAASEGDREQIAALAEEIQQVTGNTVSG